MKKTIQRFELKHGDKDSYLKVRDYYNSCPENKRDPRLLLIVILYSFQQQIRFNGNHEFNNPVGMRWFNDKIMEKLISIFPSHKGIRRSILLFRLHGYAYPCRGKSVQYGTCV